MSNVNLTIGGRNFSVACAEGEEEHVTSLARMIDSKLEGMADLGTQSEARMFLFAALILADELHDARSAADRQAEGAEIQAATAARLADMAARLEKLTSDLEA